MELAEARAKRTEDQLAALAAKIDSSGGGTVRRDEAKSSDDGGRTLGDHVERDRWRKLEIPIFSGDGAYGWTHRLERYLSYEAFQRRKSCVRRWWPWRVER